MVPTLNVGDRLFVSRVYNPEKLKRGEIVVFHSDEKDEDMIKRLIGLPGDKVEIKEDGTVNVNNEKLDEPYIKYPGGKVNMNFEVPEDKYLLLGDNRDNSKDARYWSDKYIDGDDILGKAQITVWPLNRFNFAS